MELLGFLRAEWEAESSMASGRILLRKNLILWHRWMGVIFSVLFVVWFASGIVLMYWPYPAVSPAARVEKGAVLDASRVNVDVETAKRLAGAAKAERVRLTMLDGRPVYRFHEGRLQKLAYADQAEPFAGVDQAAALRIAAAWTGQPAAAARFDGALTEEDQWTLNKVVRPLRPFLRYSWPDGQEVYVSQVTGEVMQDTTRAARMGAYFGAIPHWIYFTPLRKETATWRAVVIALSLAGTVMTLLGIVVGLWLYSPSKRFKFADGPSSIPYAGWKRWHTILGLVFGLVTFTWILSGLFSMNPWQWSPESGPDPKVVAALRGGQWNAAAFGAEQPGEFLRRTGVAAKELELVIAFDRGSYVVRDGERVMTAVVGGALQLTVPLAEVQARVVRAMGGAALREARVVSSYEDYYVTRDKNLPLPAYYFEFADAERSMHYVDAATGQVVRSYVSLSRWNRWLYHGLHSLDLPWLYRTRPSWDLVVMVLMLGGMALSVTSVWIAVVRVRRKAREAARYGTLEGRATGTRSLGNSDTHVPQH
jgi:hypothetical protein